jgi:uncharacterized damage-inducible protein DinB
MAKMTQLVIVGVGLLAGCVTISAQSTKQYKNAAQSIGSIMDAQLGVIERQIVPAAEAMPAEKYSFAPGAGEVAGVRTFALEVRHVAAANLVFFSAILGTPPPAGASMAGATNGPDDLQSKEQILKYLKNSFALGHKALVTLTNENALNHFQGLPIPFNNTRLALATFTLIHISDHYGQMVEYLRMNGIVPPASVGQPPANPPGN